MTNANVYQRKQQYHSSATNGGGGGGRVFALRNDDNKDRRSTTSRGGGGGLTPTKLLKFLIVGFVITMVLIINTVMKIKKSNVTITSSSTKSAPRMQRSSPSSSGSYSRKLKKLGDDTIPISVTSDAAEPEPDAVKNNIDAAAAAAADAKPTVTEISHALSILRRGNARPGWTLTTETPFEFIESSCTMHASELWCVGGYANGETASFNYETDTWTMRPRMAIKIEHIFNTAFSVNDGKTIAVIGGVGFPPRGVDNNRPFKVRIQLLDTDVAPEEEMKWRVGDNETECGELDIGGISTCTPVPVNGIIYCVFGTDYNFIRTDTMRFFSFDPKAMRFTQLPTPPTFYSHVTLLSDAVRNRIVLLASRIVRKKLQTDEPSRTTYFFDITTGTWNVDEPQTLPDFMPSLEGRTMYQDASTTWGYLIGGQNNAGSWVSELIYKYTMSEDPEDKEVHIEWYSRQPGLAKFGSSVREAPPGSGRLIMVGGGLAVGPFPVNEVWYWDQRRMETLHAYHLQRRTPGDTRPQPKHQVLSATFGNYDVTKKIQKFLDDGWTHFNSRALPDLDLLDDWQWLPRKGVHVVTKQSNGKVYRTGWPIWPLAVTLLEPDGWMRVVICAKGSGCKFSFWDEAEESKVFEKLDHYPQWEFPRSMGEDFKIQ